LSARGGASTPRGPPSGPKDAWFTPREERPGGSDSLRAAAGASLGLTKLPTASAEDTGKPATAAVSVSYGGGGASSFRLGAHVAPGVPPGGKAGGVNVFERGLRPDVIIPSPRTPDSFGELQKRHRKRTGPGDMTMHWGLHDRRPPDPGDGYGRKSEKAENVAANFLAHQRVGIAEYINTRGEAIYKSTQDEPLGKAFSRGHVLPDCTKAIIFKGFGCDSIKGPETAKEAVFPRNMPETTEVQRQLYKKSHGNFDPGEMHVRDYVWPKVIASNPHFHFGLPDATEVGGGGAGAKRALTSDCGDGDAGGGVPKTRIVNLKSENYKKVSEDTLAASKNLLQNARQVPDDHTFGIRSGLDGINAGELIRGFYNEDAQRPDSDLGKCIMAGRRNYVTQRHMGVPSIRLDKAAPAPEKRSVANATNFGDDLDAFGLISPNKYLFLGVTGEDFQVRRAENESKSLFAGAGHQISDSDFQRLFQGAVELYQDGEQAASLELLMALYADQKAAGLL